MMKKTMMNLFARTPIHVGAGNAVGIVDAPIQRERHTRLPIIPGSALKGVLSKLWNDNSQRNEEGVELFGRADARDAEKAKDAKAGSLLIGEGRVLAFPVRSAKGMFAWLCCPLVLGRLKQDTGADFSVPKICGDEVLASSNLSLKDKVILEEYSFTIKEYVSDKIVAFMNQLIPDDPVWKDVGKRLVIVSDEIFQHFCENACEVVTRIAIDDETGIVKAGALFNMEQVPSETLFYSILLSRSSKNIDTLKQKINQEDCLQIGGDASIGLGFCSVSFQEIQKS